MNITLRILVAVSLLFCFFMAFSFAAEESGANRIPEFLKGFLMGMFLSVAIGGFLGVVYCAGSFVIFGTI